MLYVWFDAPIGYVSFTSVLCERLGEGADAYRDWWMNPDCRIVNFIGEDNIVFHAITFPAMMLATHNDNAAQGVAGEYQMPHNVVANAFLQHMVRNIAGTLLRVGKGEAEVEWVGQVLEGRDRRRGGATAPPGGLYLTHVEYDADTGLPDRPCALWP